MTIYFCMSVLPNNSDVFVFATLMSRPKFLPTLYVGNGDAGSGWPCFVPLKMLNYSHSPLPIFTAAFDPSPAFWRDCTSLSPSSKDLSVVIWFSVWLNQTPFESLQSSCKAICFSSLPFLLLALKGHSHEIQLPIFLVQSESLFFF